MILCYKDLIVGYFTTNKKVNVNDALTILKPNMKCICSNNDMGIYKKENLHLLPENKDEYKYM